MCRKIVKEYFTFVRLEMQNSQRGARLFWALLCKFSIPGPSCSKLTMSLVNGSLKFTSSDTQIC